MSTLSLDEYQDKAMRTAGDLSQANSKRSITYSMGGVGGEAGEYVDVVKKFLFHDRAYDESREKAIKELGDLLWGVAQAASAWGVSLEEVAIHNLVKLQKRYPDGYSHDASRNRPE